MVTEGNIVIYCYRFFSTLMDYDDLVRVNNQSFHSTTYALKQQLSAIDLLPALKDGAFSSNLP